MRGFDLIDSRGHKILWSANSSKQEMSLLQVHFEWWRRVLKYFWMSVVIYTMMVLILIYTCQFESSMPFWSNVTNMDTER